MTVHISFIRGKARGHRPRLQLIQPSGIWISGHGLPQFRRRWGGHTPSIHCFRAPRPNSRVMLRFVGNIVDVTGVLGHISKWISEITKDVVAGSMTSRPPSRLDTISAQIGYAAHQLIDTRYQVRDVIYRSMRRGIERNVVVLAGRTKECHLLATPVGNPETQHRCIEFRYPSHVGSVHNNVTDRDGIDNFGMPAVTMVRYTR